MVKQHVMLGTLQLNSTSCALPAAFAFSSALKSWFWEVVLRVRGENEVQVVRTLGEKVSKEPHLFSSLALESTGGALPSLQGFFWIHSLLLILQNY